MRDLIILPFSVNAWNAIKFILVECLISLAFAPLWMRYIRSSCHRIVEEEERPVIIISSEIGRLTPASVIVYRTDACNGKFLNRIDAKHLSRALLLSVNLFLLASLLLTEYGSGSTSSSKKITASVTDVRNHRALVAAIESGNISTSALTPLNLAPQEYSYTKKQSIIHLKERVRALNNTYETIMAKGGDKRQNSFEVCGISSTSTVCAHSFDDSDGTMEVPEASDVPRIYRIRNLAPLSPQFSDFKSHDFYATGIEEVGVLPKLYPAPRNYTLDCIVHGFNVTIGHYLTYELDYCVSAAGDMDLFFVMKDMRSQNAGFFLIENPELKNESGAFYCSSRIYRKSLFGINRRSVYSRKIALYQLRHLGKRIDQYIRVPGQSENIYMDSVKERLVWALLGMVSGNSAIRTIEAEGNEEFATLNAFFVSGIVCILSTLLVLLLCGSYFGPRRFLMPVTSGAMLKTVRAADCERQHGRLSAERKWPELYLTGGREEVGRLSFYGDGGLSSTQSPEEKT